VKKNTYIAAVGRPKVKQLKPELLYTESKLFFKQGLTNHK